MPTLVYLAVQGAITVVLLVFAFAIRGENPDASNIVLGAAVGYWLGESPRSGKLVANGVSRHAHDRASGE